VAKKVTPDRDGPCLRPSAALRVVVVRIARDVAEFETQATAAARCAGHADKLECLLRAREP
jgi:hypothetical protein